MLRQLNTMRLLLFTWCGAVFLAANSLRAELQLPFQPRQMIVVTTKNWDAVDGQLQRYAKDRNGWKAVGEAIRIVVGRHGLGWGDGLHPMPQPGPRKHEGDGKSPAGIFILDSAFGYAPPEKMTDLKMPYVQCTSTLECVDDTNSTHYNHILERPSVPEPDWHSSEHMLMANGQYRLGIVIDHDTSPAVPGHGSCVFMHIWLGPGIGTSGCTAMTPGNIETVVKWLDISAHPVLVQLPEAEYGRLQNAWNLPALPGR
jgi:D-alanyl-D-alanine dipeptidase